MNKIKELRDLRGITQRQLANDLDLAISTVSAWEQQVRDPNSTQRQKLCKYFNISEADLFIGSSIKEDNLSIPLNKIPVISWVHACQFEEAVDIHSVGQADEYVFVTDKGENMFALTVKNDCMEPRFYEGDIIIVNPHASVENGDFAIIKDVYNQECTFKQYKQYGKQVILHPLNPKYEDIPLNGEKKYRVIGKVVGIYKKF